MNILIIRLSALGDIVHCLPVAAYLKATIPNLTLSWLVEPAGAELLLNNPAVDEVIVFEKKRFSKSMNHPGEWTNTFAELNNFVNTLKKKKFDAVIDAQGLFKSGFLAWMSGAKRRFGFANTREFAHLFLTDSLDVGDYFFGPNHIVSLNLQLANFVCKRLGFTNQSLDASLLEKQEFITPLPPVSDENKNKVDQMLFADGHNVVVLMPGTTWTSKIWPEQKWCDLAVKIGKENNCKIVLVGTNRESEVNSKIDSYLKQNFPAERSLDLTGKTSLPELLALLNRAQLVIGADSGPLHLAAATAKPQVLAIFGSTPHWRNGPYGPKGQAIALDLSCQPCFEKKCPLSTKACLVDLSVDTVFAAAEQYLN